MSLEEGQVTKPVERNHSENLRRVRKEVVVHAFQQLVEHTHPSKGKGDVTTSVHAFAHSRVEWLHKAVPDLENLAQKYHIGNFVAIRGTNQRIFESMPIYARLGMHMLFYGKEQVKLLEGNKLVEDVLREQSVRQGKVYDSPESVKNIPSFIKMYNIQLDELLEPDIHKYHTFNQFFYRRLKPGARPVENADNPRGFCSAADCRLVVYQTVDLAETFWIKGDEFSIPSLLGLEPTDPVCETLRGSSLAIFRLAPADYHRFHSPVDGRVLTAPRDIPGEYYTVNPQAVNEPKLDVFTRNKRSVLLIEHEVSKKPIAIVAVGALLVGSITWTYNDEIKRGDEIGYFAYGGSTVIAVFPPGLIEFDGDLVLNSTGRSEAAAGQGSIETLVKVGYSLGKMPDAV
ncbi:phosphatidylserine decarboxylase-domain-containing protein [Pisolithus marmoratus]|nr:phosphatidylserine decarboxylase-domain-containing protein [Pisolithus marmoratus]